jgi:hypothetical protein
MFAIEDRNTTDKNVTFLCIDRHTGKVLWQDVRLDEPWWISMGFIEGGTLILHGFSSPDMPDPKGIYALDLSTGAVKWSNGEMRPLFTGGGSIFAGRVDADDQRFFELDLAGGSIVRELDPAVLSSLRAMPSRQASPVVFPTGRDAAAGFPDPEIERLYHARLSAYERGGLVEAINRPGALVFGIYEQIAPDPLNPSYAQRLEVLDPASGSVIYDDTLIGKTPVCVPDTFFCIDDSLYYIRERNTLCAVRLPAPP